MLCFLSLLKGDMLTAAKKRPAASPENSSAAATANQPTTPANTADKAETTPASSVDTHSTTTPTVNHGDAPKLSEHSSESSPPPNAPEPAPSKTPEGDSEKAPPTDDEKKPTTAPIANPAVIYTDVTNNVSYSPDAPDLELLWNCKYGDNMDADKCIQAQVFFCGRCSRLNCAILENRAVCLDLCGAKNPLMKPCVEAGQRIMTLQELPKSPEDNQNANAMAYGLGLDPRMALLGLGLGAGALGAAAGIGALKGIKGPHIISGAKKAGHAIASGAKKAAAATEKAAKIAAAATAKAAKEAAAATAKASKEAAAATAKASKDAANAAKNRIHSLRSIF